MSSDLPDFLPRKPKKGSTLGIGIERLENWRPLQLTNRLRPRDGFATFANSSKAVSNSKKEWKLPLFDYEFDRLAAAEDERPTCGKQFHQYCKYTTMHGIRYLAEDRRHFSEKIFWTCWCVFGVTAAIYLMSKIYTRWESSPVITSVSNTNFPVTNINFPAVTICTVNKAVNEKMIIQACNLNMNLTEIQTIISELVDPESRNNENDGRDDRTERVNATMRIKLLRLVAPKCEDYILTCKWNETPENCSKLFNLTLTDTGYCCTFNAAHAKIRRSEKENGDDVVRSEREYNELQEAIWFYADQVHQRGIPTPAPQNPTDGRRPLFTTTPLPPIKDEYSCARTFDDSLFPEICGYLRRLQLSNRTRSPPPVNETQPTYPMPSFPWKALGAGRSRGLTLLLDTLRCDAVPTDSFKGLRVFVHDPEEFPAVGERGFIVGPGTETQVAVTATDTYSPEVLRAFAPQRRGCYFSNEYPLEYHPEYSRSSCVLECENKYILEKCNCLPYYAPGSDNTTYLCSMSNTNCTTKATGKNTETAKKKPAAGLNCTEVCLPACNETFYNFVVTSALFPNQREPSMTKVLREAAKGEKREFLNDIQYIRASVSVLRIFFRESSIMQYKRGELFTWEDFVSNLGGVMGLCLGFSLLSLVEIIYFFTIRTYLDWKRYRRNAAEGREEEREGVETGESPVYKTLVAQSWM